MSVDELCLMSRALERAITALPGKPRRDVTTHQLSVGIEEAAKEGIRDEETLARRALESVGIDSDIYLPAGLTVPLV
jgi:hypothetical protein